MNSRRLEGVWSPMPTPLLEDGRVDRRSTGALVDHLLENGVDGLFPLGTSGEFALLTREERKQVVAEVTREAAGRVPVFAGISDPSTENMLEFAADARRAGADGVIATPPYYYSTTHDGLRNHFKLLAEKVGLPLMVYNIPDYTHCFVPVDVIKSLAEDEVIVGMKYTENNLFNLLDFLTATRDLRNVSIFTGSDTMTYACLEFGGAGGIIGSSNIDPALASSVFDAYRAGDFASARDAQLDLIPLVKASQVGEFPAGLKEAMNMIGVKVGAPKEPIPPLTGEERGRLESILTSAGYLGEGMGKRETKQKEQEREEQPPGQSA